MDVVVSSPRQVEIENVRHVGNVEAAGRDIRRRQQHDLAVAEFIQRRRARALFQIAMQGAGVEAVLQQRFVQYRDVTLAIAENDRVLDVAGLDELAQHFALGVVFAIGAELEALGDRLRSRCGLRDFDAFRIFQELTDEARNFRRHRCREE